MPVETAIAKVVRGPWPSDSKVTNPPRLEVGQDGDGTSWGEDLTERLKGVLSLQPVASNPRGVAAAAEWAEAELRHRGFEVHRFAQGASPPVLVATRPGVGRVRVGLSGHYDVEEAGQGWATDPFEPTVVGGRLYGRGTADNLGPLMLRLLVLDQLGPMAPPLLVVLHGEEEVGSPAAHLIYPTLRLPPVAIWIEETGYFESDGRQRMLLRRPDARARRWVRSLVGVAAAHGRDVDLHDRYLNKAFGPQRCPFHAHLAPDAPYLAIGPNDPGSSIHRPDESISISNLAVSADQFAALLHAAAAEPG